MSDRLRTQPAGSEGERWLAIPEHPMYEVSDLGRVRSLRWPTPRILRPALGSHGYQQVQLGRGNQWCVHRLVLLAFVGPREPGQETRHLDGEKQNNRLANLTYGSQSENTMDRVRHGTHQWANKTSCPRGHAYDYVSPSGWRSCRTCARAARERYLARKQAA